MYFSWGVITNRLLALSTGMNRNRPLNGLPLSSASSPSSWVATSLALAYSSTKKPTDSPVIQSTSNTRMVSSRLPISGLVPATTMRLRRVSTRITLPSGASGWRMLFISSAPMYWRGMTWTL